jgi:hypothetical protein
MAKSFTCKTKSPAGNMILGVLFLCCALLLVAAPCLAIVGTAAGSVTLPKDGHEVLETLIMLGVCLAMAVATLALGVLCLHATLLPKTLEITDEGIELFWFTKRLGKVPFTNVKEAFVKTRAMAGQTAEGAAAQAFFTGGWIAGMVAQSRFDPNESIGIVIKLADGSDPDTFWPKGLFKKAQKKRLEVDYYWKLPHGKLVEKIAKAVERHKRLSPTR